MKNFSRSSQKPTKHKKANRKRAAKREFWTHYETCCFALDLEPIEELEGSFPKIPKSATLNFTAENADSLIDLIGLTNFDDTKVNFSEVSGGVINLPDP